MAIEIAAPIAVAAFLILSGETSCPEIQWTDEQGIEWTEEVCMSGSMSGSEYEPVRFDATVSGAVPEPGTWGLMVLGFGLAGWGLRRSRQALRTPLKLVAHDLGPAGPPGLSGGVVRRDEARREPQPNQRITSSGRSAAPFRFNPYCVRHGYMV